MATSNRIAEVAAAMGKPARAAMLAALMDGRALTATKLADVASVTPQTASGHLARLIAVGLIAAERQDRHRYHRLASPEVARMIESVMQIAGGVTLARFSHRVGPRDAALRGRAPATITWPERWVSASPMLSAPAAPSISRAMLRP